MAFLVSSCSKDDELWNDPDSDYDVEIVQGPDEIIADGLIRVNNLLYQVNEDKTCTLIKSQTVYNESGWTDKRYYSKFPYPVFDIPDKVTLRGNTYQVTAVNLSGGAPNEKDNHIREVKYLSIPSSVLSYTGGSDLGLISLSIGANVRQVSDVRANKIFWLPNTPPSGYSGASGSVQYASSSAYGSEVIIYPHLSSIFSVEGISYVMTNPAERKCDLIGVFAPSADNIKCNGTITKDGISFDIENIAQYAFYGCTNIADVSISNIDNIGDFTFSGCTKLSNVSLDNIKTIGNSCFSKCAFSKISIPGTVSTIGSAAFEDCENLAEVTLQDGDGKLCFDCPYSTSIFLGAKVKKLYIGRDLYYSTSDDQSPFYRMDTLEDVEIRNGETEISNSMFYGCISLKTVIIGDDITKIGSKAFSGCSSMTSFKFGKELRSIGADAFSDCTALTSFTSDAINPPTCGSQALDDINKWECILHVPAESIEAYKTADQWKNFLKIE